MLIAFPTSARAAAVVIERRALANGLDPVAARQCAIAAQTVVRTGRASSAAVLARHGRRPRAHRNPETIA